jgi:hypothetical protein
LLMAVPLLCAGCPTTENPGEVNASLRDGFESRAFNVRRVDTNAWYTVTALKYAEGAHCIVYVDEAASVSYNAAKAVASEYDRGIYTKVTGVFGDYLEKGFDVDGNGKIILLLLDVQDGYQTSGNYVAGFFDPHHMTSQSKSNRADMLFIDVNPQIVGSRIFYTNIAHELQHLINYAIHNGTPQELWINEGLSGAAEYLYDGLQTDRVQYFNNDPRDTIAYGNNFFVWDGHWEQERGDALANYATVYLFFQWLRIQARGTAIYSAISNSANRDYRAVTGAVKARIPGFAEGTQEEIWERLLGTWMIANHLNAPAGSPQELYGYRGEIETWIHYFADPGQVRMALAPGEGVFSLLNTVKTVGSSVIADSGGHIRYLGIDPEGKTVTWSVPYSKVLLTYNANPNPEGPNEAGYVAAQNIPSRSARYDGSAFPAAGYSLRSFPIGVQDLRILQGSREAAPDLP